MPAIFLTPVRFLSEVRSELTRVVWPTRAEVIRLTAAVIFISLLVGGFIGGLDYLLTTLTTYLIK